MELNVVRLPVGALLADLCAVPFEPGEPINKSPIVHIIPAGKLDFFTSPD